jgi:hypothetical protein
LKIYSKSLFFIKKLIEFFFEIFVIRLVRTDQENRLFSNCEEPPRLRTGFFSLEKSDTQDGSHKLPVFKEVRTGAVLMH